MEHAHDVRCPQCRSRMEPGFQSSGGGLHWFRQRESPTTFAEGIPGTNAILRPVRLPAWRCRRCELILYRYGRNLEKQLDKAREQDEAEQQPQEEA